MKKRLFLIAISLLSSFSFADFVNVPSTSSKYWKSPVTNFASLPMTTNSDGDIRVVNSTHAIYQWDANSSSWFLIISGSSPGLQTLNGQSGTSQGLAHDEAGTDFNITSALDVHTFSLPIASSTKTGKLSNTDWSTFNTSALATQAATSSNTASTIVSRDSDGNTHANNFESRTQSTASGGTLTLTKASAWQQIITGGSNENIVLPAANTFSQVGHSFLLNNNTGSGVTTVKNNGGTVLFTIPAGGIALTSATDISTANGQWDRHFMIPANQSWGSGLLNLNGSEQITGSQNAVQLKVSAPGGGIQTNDLLQVINDTPATAFSVNNAGNGAFLGSLSASNFSGSCSGTNTGDITLTAVGSSPSANGASLSGQALTLQPADSTHPGVLTSAAFNSFSNKLGTSLAANDLFCGTSTNVATQCAVGGDATMVFNSTPPNSRFTINTVLGGKPITDTSTADSVMYRNASNISYIGELRPNSIEMQSSGSILDLNTITRPSDDALTIDNEGTTLYDPDIGLGVINWSSGLVNSPLYSAQSMDFSAGLLISPAGSSNSIDWTNRLMYDSNSLQAIDYNNRYLLGPAETPQQLWDDTGIYFANKLVYYQGQPTAGNGAITIPENGFISQTGQTSLNQDIDLSSIINTTSDVTYEISVYVFINSSDSGNFYARFYFKDIGSADDQYLIYKGPTITGKHVHIGDAVQAQNPFVFHTDQPTLDHVNFSYDSSSVDYNYYITVKVHNGQQ